MSDLLDRIKLSKYPASVWLGKANGQEIINLIEQLQQRNAELERERDEEKFIAERMKDAVCIIETVNDQLAATVERLREAALNAISIMPSGKAKADLRDAYDDTPQQNLNALKREVAKEAFMVGQTDCGVDPSWSSASEYANTKYPSVKDGE